MKHSPNETLYHISGELLEAIDKHEYWNSRLPGTGEVSEKELEEVVTLEKLLDDLKISFEDKVKSVAYYILKLRHQHKAAMSEIDRLTKIAKSRKGAEDRLKEYLVYCMQSVGESKLESDTINIEVRENNPSIEVVDIQHIPEDYIKTKPATRTVDRIAILKAIKKDGFFPGVVLKEVSYQVRIK